MITGAPSECGPRAVTGFEASVVRPSAVTSQPSCLPTSATVTVYVEPVPSGAPSRSQRNVYA